MCRSCDFDFCDGCDDLTLPINSFDEVVDNQATQENILKALEETEETANLAMTRTVEFSDFLIGEGLENSTKDVIDKMVDSGAIDLQIEEKLTQLETDYAPRLNGLEVEVEGIIKLEGLKTTTEDPSFDNGLVINNALRSGKKIMIPNGTYNINTVVKVTDSINSTESDIPVVIQGESPYGVVLASSLSTIIDLSRSKNVNVSNLTSDKFIKLIQYGDDWIPFSRKRNVRADNIQNTSVSNTGEPINHGLLINTPAPPSYAENGGGGAYARYPIEIIDNSGYNSIMINKFAVDDAGDLVPAAESSAIGIVDKVSNATGVILIEGLGGRPFTQFKNPNADSKSSERADVVYEVANDGAIAIGCSSQASDPVAPGHYALKIRDNYPLIRLYDQNRSNHTASFGLVDDNLQMVTNNPTTNVNYGFHVNYLTGGVKVLGALESSNLVVNNTNTVHALNVKGVTRITFEDTSSGWIEAFSDGVAGQIIHCITKSNFTTIRHRSFDSPTYIFTTSGSNTLLEVGKVYSFIKFENGWYQM